MPIYIMYICIYTCEDRRNLQGDGAAMHVIRYHCIPLWNILAIVMYIIKYVYIYMYICYMYIIIYIV
jgi:hypothetical protein